MFRWNSWLPSGSPARFVSTGSLAELGNLRQRVVAARHDCHSPAADRLRLRLIRSHTADELWLARCDVCQLIANEHCEGTAVQRINELVPAFDGWLPPT